MQILGRVLGLEKWTKYMDKTVRLPEFETILLDGEPKNYEVLEDNSIICFSSLRKIGEIQLKDDTAT